jgi:hypothetical protein
VLLMPLLLLLLLLLLRVLLRQLLVPLTQPRASFYKRPSKPNNTQLRRTIWQQSGST